ncbi:DUF6404 family protein [Metallibacterium scheffleri]|uniref:DUF6404 family protein n=1 Tax=Metallibacterium scheffleri TaxID=993689 RepID=UPI003CCFF1E9
MTHGASLRAIRSAMLRPAEEPGRHGPCAGSMQALSDLAAQRRAVRRPVAMAPGCRVPPPHFAPFWLIAVVYGTWFAVARGVIMRLVFWPRQGASLLAMAVDAAVAGALSGLSMAACHAHARRQ